MPPNFLNKSDNALVCSSCSLSLGASGSETSGVGSSAVRVAQFLQFQVEALVTVLAQGSDLALIFVPEQQPAYRQLATSRFHQENFCPGMSTVSIYRPCSKTVQSAEASALTTKPRHSALECLQFCKEQLIMYRYRYSNPFVFST